MASAKRALTVRLGKQWRRLATGLCFLTFMMGSLGLAVLLAPLIRLSIRRSSRRRDIVLRIIQRFFKFFMAFMVRTGPIREFEVTGLGHISDEGPFLLVANHPTLIDVVGIISCLPTCNCVVKRSLWNHFFMGGVMRAADYIPNNSPRQLIDDSARSFEIGRSLLVFPEGTRSPRGTLGTFSRGAAQIALRTGAKILPIVITCDPPTLLKGEPWHQVPPEPVHFKISFQPPLPIPDSIRVLDELPLQSRALTRYLKDYFREKLGYSTLDGSALRTMASK